MVLSRKPRYPHHQVTLGPNVVFESGFSGRPGGGGGRAAGQETVNLPSMLDPRH